jgi:polysaccharide export outer membrane protein
MAFALMLVAVAAGPLAAQAPPMVRGGETPRSYVIGSQDQLSIIVFDEPALTGKYKVEGDGYFTFPLLDRVQASGRTLSDLQVTLTAMLAEGYLKNPQVRVEIDQYKSQQVVVTGEVKAPGPITISDSAMTLLTAIAMAGSTTANASNEVIVVRRSEAGQQSEEIRINRRELELGQAGHDVVLRDGDIINVPKAQAFYISGYVRNPGSYVLDPGMTVQQAIALAGGLTERGSDRRLSASRLVKGKTTQVPLKLDDKVQPNDTIKISPKFF